MDSWVAILAMIWIAVGVIIDGMDEGIVIILAMKANTYEE